jgi:serine/threonine-protein kinase
MGLWASLKRRRIFPFLGAYLAAGFLALEGVDQLVGNGLLPLLAYELVLVIYLFGIPFTAILAWFHGEKGAQKPPPAEIWVQTLIVVAALVTAGMVYRDHLRDQATSAEAAAAAGFDASRIAVLYFEDLSSDGQLGYLADGLTEGLIDRLSQVRALDLISRNGVAPFRDSGLRWDSIAALLGAGSLIAGSVERAGERIRVTARLVDGASGADIERRTFEFPVGEQLVLSDSLSQDVAMILRERLGEEVRLREQRAGTSNPDAWVLVQRAERVRKDAEAFIEEDDYDRAFAAFAEADSILAIAEELDPDWPAASVLRGNIAYRQGRLDLDNWEQWSAVASGHADRALDVASNDAQALELKGTVQYATWLFERPEDPDDADRLIDQAKTNLEQATQFNPTLASAYSTLSHLYYQIEDVPGVVIAARTAYEEDAYLEFADAILWRLFNASLDLEQFSQANRWCNEGSERFPENYRFASCQLLMAITPAVEPEVDRAWDLLAQIDSLTPERWREYESIDGHMMVAGVLARAGMADSARSVLATARGRVNSEVDPDQDMLTTEAYVLTLLGDYDRAVDLWRRYAAAHPGHFDDDDDISWWWRDLMSHPEFQNLVESS